MAITQPEAIRYSDKYMRINSDWHMQLYNDAKIALEEWTSNNMQQYFPNDVGEIVRDSASPNDDVGTGGDGRKVISGSTVQNYIGTLNAYVTYMEENSETNLNNSIRLSTNNTR